MTSQSKGVALITGASAGIGAVYADRLARRGYDLILVARDGDRLASIAGRLAAETGRTIEPLVADLTARAELRKVEDRLREDPRITMLVNSAGIADARPLLAADVERMETMISLNVTALMRLTYAAAPGFAARMHGTIISIASVGALAPEILNGVYDGTKAFVLVLAQSLHQELGGHGVRVQAVLPGATATGLWEGTGTLLEELDPEIVMTAEDMVDAALAGLDLGELVTIPSLPDAAEWLAIDAARKALAPRLSSARPAARYVAGAI